MALSARLASLKEAVDAICSATGVPGLSLGVARGGELIHSYDYGYADIATKSQPSSDTRYGIGSITKAITASAIGILVDEGKIDFETLVKSVLPDFNSSSQEVTDKATITDLLGHTTGLAVSNHWWYGAENQLIISKKDTMPYFNNLQIAAPFREKAIYSNWGYTVAAEVIEKLSGMSLGDYVNDKIFEPLNMSNSTLNHNCTSNSALAKPYAALDDASVVPIDPPQAQDGTIMAGAQGIQSTVKDMLTYSNALISAYASEQSTSNAPKSKSVLRHVTKQFSPHIAKGTGSDSIDSFGLGFSIHQLPSRFKGLGCNGMYTKEMPLISAKSGKPTIMVNNGSLAGYTCMISVIPDLDVSIAVCTNSIGLANPSQWVHNLLLESVVEEPNPHDYVALAKDAAKGHVENSRSMMQDFEKMRESNKKRPSSAYTGRYEDEKRGFIIDILESEGSELLIRFQGLEKQVWPLRYFKDDSFMWLESRDVQAARARFTYSGLNVFKIIFDKEESGKMMTLCWPHEPSQPIDQQRFVRVDEKVTGHGRL